MAVTRTNGEKPTVVPVRGAFAESSSWNSVIARLVAEGYPVLPVANPLRGVAVDAAYLRTLLDHLTGDIVCVGPSYGGSVITNAATGHSSVKALVHVGAFAPDEGEDALGWREALLAAFQYGCQVTGPRWRTAISPRRRPPTPCANGPPRSEACR